MRRPPPLTRVASYPVVGGLGVVALLATLAWMMERVDIDPVVLDVRTFWAEPWRLVTSVLPHIGLLHLGFNLYWLWILGTRVEEVFGHARTLLIVLVFAAGSGAAEYALQDGGVGLSGVGYGLFGVSWWLARYDPRFADAMDQRTARLFAAWFLLCIVLTAAEWLPVANVAHGMGWLQGLAMGAAVATGAKAARSSARAVGVAASVGLLALSLAGATVLRPLVNQSPEAGVDSARLGYLALLDTHNQVAADHLERALALNDHKDWWTNLGIAYRGLGREREAAAAFERADSMAD